MNAHTFRDQNENLKKSAPAVCWFTMFFFFRLQLPVLLRVVLTDLTGFL